MVSYGWGNSTASRPERSLISGMLLNGISLVFWECFLYAVMMSRWVQEVLEGHRRLLRLGRLGLVLAQAATEPSAAPVPGSGGAGLSNCRWATAGGRVKSAVSPFFTRIRLLSFSLEQQAVPLAFRAINAPLVPTPLASMAIAPWYWFGYLVLLMVHTCGMYKVGLRKSTANSSRALR